MNKVVLISILTASISLGGSAMALEPGRPPAAVVAPPRFRPQALPQRVRRAVQRFSERVRARRFEGTTVALGLHEKDSFGNTQLPARGTHQHASTLWGGTYNGKSGASSGNTNSYGTATTNAPRRR